MSDDWLAAGQGVRPERRWSFATDAPLVALETARETGETVLADSSGGLYRLDRNGRIAAITHGFHGIRGLCWGDVGGGAVLSGEAKLSRLDADLAVVWSLELHDAVRVIAVDPHGQYVAAALANGETVILDPAKRKVSRFVTVRPLSFLRFLTAAPAIVGAADHGLLCRYRLDGTEEWNTRLWSSAGDLSVTDDGETIYVAAFNQGVQTFDGSGRSGASFIVEGTPERLAATARPLRLAAATIEQHLYWLDEDGELLWAAAMPEKVAALRCDPLGRWLICGFEAGRVLRLAWAEPV
ncbi:MAG: hypothetical protein WD069_03430 [Planctomycetales bacterium]